MIKKIFNYLKLMRVKHYIKNILIFLPLIFSNNLFNFIKLNNCIWAFIVFSLACSIIYIFNDIKDIEKDKLHPKKKERPLASGKVSIKEAIILIILLVLLVIGGMFYLKASIYSILLVVIYIILNIGYSICLKNIPLLDIIVLVSGFLIRVLYGASIIDVNVSNWLYLTIMALSFYLVLGKRRNEIMMTDKNTRKVLKYYNKDFLDKNMYMCLSLAIVFYALWAVTIENSYLVLTVPLIIIVCMRYSMLIEQENFGDPVEVVLSDKVIISLILLYGILIFTILYV